MPMMDMPLNLMHEPQVVIERPAGGWENRRLAPISDVPQHYASAVVAQASQAQKTPVHKERAMGICFGVDYNQSGQDYVSGGLSPEYLATAYFSGYENREVIQPPSSNAKLVTPPKHGKVVVAKYEDGSSKHQYVPAPGFIGDDKIVFRVNIDGTAVSVVYVLKVTKTFTDTPGVHDSLCKKTGTQWKISYVSETSPA